MLAPQETNGKPAFPDRGCRERRWNEEISLDLASFLGSGDPVQCRPAGPVAQKPTVIRSTSVAFQCQTETAKQVRQYHAAWKERLHPSQTHNSNQLFIYLLYFFFNIMRSVTKNSSHPPQSHILNPFLSKNTIPDASSISVCFLPLRFSSWR